MAGEADHPNPGRIVAGVDGSPDGLRAVQYAARVALQVRAPLHLVHAVDQAMMAGAWGVVHDIGEMENVGREALADAREVALGLGVREPDLTSEVVIGPAPGVLARASAGALRLVVGRRRLSGLERMFVGSTSASLASLAPCPVVVIPAAVNPDETGDRGVIAVGVDSDGRSDETLHQAHREAQERRSRLIVTHSQARLPVGMFGTQYVDEGAQHDLVVAARTEIDEAVRRVIGQHPDVPVEVVVSTGDPVDRLIDLSREVDLLVLGLRAPTRLGFSLGGVTRAVLAHACAPLMVVH